MSKTNVPQEDQEQFWHMAIETWQTSGLSVRQFCRDEGLSEPQFYVWRRKLNGSNSKQIGQNKPEPSAFIEVAMPRSTSAVIELVLTSGNMLRIPHGADAETLNTVLSTVRAIGLC